MTAGCRATKFGVFTPLNLTSRDCPTKKALGTPPKRKGGLLAPLPKNYLMALSR